MFLWPQTTSFFGHRPLAMFLPSQGTETPMQVKCLEQPWVTFDSLGHRYTPIPHHTHPWDYFLENQRLFQILQGLRDLRSRIVTPFPFLLISLHVLNMPTISPSWFINLLLILLRDVIATSLFCTNEKAREHSHDGISSELIAIQNKVTSPRSLTSQAVQSASGALLPAFM